MTAPLPLPTLAAQGLNLQAVLALHALPAEVLAQLAPTEAERAAPTQLLVLGHQGRGLWTALQQRGLHGAHPVDDFVSECLAACFAGPLAGHRWRQLFPGPQLVGLQRLGELAGWHHRSPFMVGVDAEWGSWFAYRAVVLADTRLPLTPRRELASPCLSCADPPCLSACPANALTPAWHFQACLDHRLAPGSSCEDRCLARNRCPVGEAHRYSDEQTAYHYRQSLPALRAWRDRAQPDPQA